jgi:precorrin-3B C17-methyltransferase
VDREAGGGRIRVVGIGPGAASEMTAAARRAIEEADVIVGYRTYLRLIEDLAPDTCRVSSGMRQEVDRVRRAIDLAESGQDVVLVSGGDAGVYGMAGLVFEVLEGRGAAGMETRPTRGAGMNGGVGCAAVAGTVSDAPSLPPSSPKGGRALTASAGLETSSGASAGGMESRGALHIEGVRVEVVPGVSALNAAAALLGAPLMTDFCAISLSDQLVELEGIVERVELAARAGFVICLYNPKSRRRVEPFRRTCEILARHRRPDTPVGIVRAAYREGQRVTVTTLSELPNAEIDMVTIVIVGSERTYVADGKMVTRRGYRAKYDLESA